MKTDITFLGYVDGVLGSRVSIRIAGDAQPSASPIVNGRMYRLGQVGSFVRIPIGFTNIYGLVSRISARRTIDEANSESDFPTSTDGERWLEVQLLGESIGTDGFQRGVSVFPTLSDEAHIITEDDLRIIYGATSPSLVGFGTHAASDGLMASLDIDKLLTRHAAILGSTGSGKSNTVAAFLKALSDGDFPNSRVVIIDPHGEYGAALADRAKVFSIGDDKNPLVVPYWAMSFDELAWFLVDRKSSAEAIQDSNLRDHIFEKRKASCVELKAGKLKEDEITVDSPVPFGIRELWYHFDRRERVTYNDMPRSVEALIEEGDAKTLKSARFAPPGAGSAAPFKPSTPQVMSGYVSKILARLRDKRFEFLLEPKEFDGKKKDLDELLASWIGHEKPVTVLDLGGVPFEIVDLVVGVVTRLLFDCMFWGRDLPGIGRQRPLLLVFEEAHGYLPKGAGGQFISGYAGRAVRRVFKEGRKYGIGAIVVSQRPSELDESVLSQCGTFIALRLSNSEDQSRVRATVPDALGGLIDLLPALRTGEAIVLGEAVQIPSRVRLKLVEPRPRSNDPEVAKSWKAKAKLKSAYDEVVTRWRRQKGGGK